MTASKADIAKIKAKLADREWRMDNLYHIKDKWGNTIRFVRNESQLEFWDNMWWLNLILKDRQRGFSTLFAITILDMCLFNSGTEAGIIDITLPDGKKKLAKIKLAYDLLPEAIKAEIPLTTDAKEQLVWANGSAVYVGTSHRGGTLQILHISEMGKIAAKFPERAREIRTGALNTIAQGNLVFCESTAEGNSGEFYEDCQLAQERAHKGEKLTMQDYKFHFFGWWMGDENEMDPDGIEINSEWHAYFDKLEGILGIEIGPRKRAWYVKKAGQQKGDMKREYPSTPDEAFEAAIEGAYLADIITGMKQRGQIGVVPIDRAYPVNSGWDFGLSDQMTIWLHQKIGLQHRLVGYIAGTDQDVLYYWREMNTRFDGVIWGEHYLPHDAEARRIGTAKDATAPPKTLEQILNDAGMQNTNIVPRIHNKAVAIQQVKIWLPQVYIDQANCGTTHINPITQKKDDATNGIKCLQNFRREWDEKAGTWSNTPRHDWAMHGYDGLEALVRGLAAYSSDRPARDAATTKAAKKGDWRSRMRQIRRTTGQAA